MLTAPNLRLPVPKVKALLILSPAASNLWLHVEVKTTHERFFVSRCKIGAGMMQNEKKKGGLPEHPGAVCLVLCAA